MPKRNGTDEGLATAAEPAKKKALLPIPEGGGGTVSEAKFWPYIESLTPEDWSHAFGYLYGDWPIADHFLPYPDEKTARRAGAVKYLERLNGPFERDTILHLRGSGKYHIDFNDTNKAHDATVCTCYFTLNDERFPPQRDPLTIVLGHPDNRSYVAQLRREGKLPPEGGQMVPQSTDTAMAREIAGVLRDAINAISNRKDPGGTEAVFTKALDMMSKASDKAVEMAVGQVKSESPEGFIGTLKAFRELMPAPQGSSNDKMFELMIKMQADNQKLAAEVQAKNTELLMKLIEAKSAPAPKDESQSFMRPLVEKLIERSLDTLDGGGGSGKFDWREMIPLAVDRLAPGLNGLFGGLGFLMRRAAGGTAPAPPPAGNPAPPEAPGAIAGQPEGDPANMMLAEIAGPLVQHLLDPEATGTDFALWFVRGAKQLNGMYTGGYGVRAHAEVVAMGKEKLLGMAKMFPPLWAQIEPVGGERINAFLDEFLAFDDEAYEPEDEADSGPQAVPPKRRAKKGEGA